MLKIAFPEFDNPIIREAISTHDQLRRANQPLQHLSASWTEIKAIPAPDLATACQMVQDGTADTMIAGIEHSTRDVILACRDHFQMATDPETKQPYKTFSGLVVMRRDSELYLLSDMAACKHPTADQLREIVEQTHTSAQKLLPDRPRIAMLSFSTIGSGGKDTTIDIIQETLTSFAERDIFIAGEMQLDAAVNPRIGLDKSHPENANPKADQVAGKANVLIAPDLNSGNLIYKVFEQLAGFTVAGPILQGFDHVISDLSRGSTVADVIWTIEVLAKLIK
jgi:phosphotransacetylase